MAEQNKGFLYRTLEALQDNFIGVLIAGALLSGAGAWTHKMYSSYNEMEVQRKRIETGLELKIGDFNGKGSLDKYYEINEQKAPLEIDGKPVAEYFKK